MSFPTTLLELFLITLLIDAYEQRDVAIFDVPGAFLQAKLAKKSNNERTLMKLEGEFVDIMCEINPEHKPNIIYENGKKTLYLVFKINFIISTLFFYLNHVLVLITLVITKDF